MAESSSSSTMRNKQPFLETSSTDRISNLPDCLLIYMISFLSLDDAFRTSFISRRFRNLWKQLPDLDFTPKLEIKAPLVAFVDRLLSLHEAPTIRRLRVAFFYEESHASSVYSWIRFALTRHVQELELVLFPLDYSSPRLGFTLPTACTSLRSLKLQHFEVHLAARFVTRFQSLEVLSLCYVTCRGSVITGVISCSPRLATLDIVSCEIKGELSIVDSRGQLLWLRVGLWSENGVYESKSKIEIHAPNLEFLEIANYMPRAGYHLNCPSLLTATFEFEDMIYIGKEIEWYPKLVQLLNSIGHAKCVSLCAWCIKMVYKWRKQDMIAPTFDAGHLTLNTSITTKELHGIALLLVKFQQVDTLSVFMGQRLEGNYNYLIPGFEDGEYWKTIEEVLNESGLPNLKAIEVCNFLESENFDAGAVQRAMEVNEFFERWGNEVKFVQFMLKQCRNLKSLTIRSSVLKKLRGSRVISREVAHAIFTRIRCFPRVSPNVKLIVA